MDISSGDISAMVFKRVVRNDPGEFSLDGHALNVLMELDGKTNLAEVGRKTGLNMATLRTEVSKLLELNLIEVVEGAVPKVDNDFLEFLRERLATAVGPISEVLIEDAVNDLGYTLQDFPSHRAAELIDLLSRQIRREDKMSEFRQQMLNKIKEKGY